MATSGLQKVSARQGGIIARTARSDASRLGSEQKGLSHWLGGASARFPKFDAMAGKVDNWKSFQRSQFTGSRWMNLDREPFSPGTSVSVLTFGGKTCLTFQVIYQVLAACVYVAVSSGWPSDAVWVAVAVFLIGFISAWGFYRYVTYKEKIKWHQVLLHTK
jgi:hypothetical protein